MHAIRYMQRWKEGCGVVSEAGLTDLLLIRHMMNEIYAGYSAQSIRSKTTTTARTQLFPLFVYDISTRYIDCNNKALLQKNKISI